MTRQHFSVASLLAIVVVAGCQRSVDHQTSQSNERTDPPAVVNTAHQQTPEEPVPETVPLVSEDVLQDVVQMNSRVAHPSQTFRSGHVEPLAADETQVIKNDRGFTIQLPSESPIPTPTIHQGRLYVSGGFSSREYYCFDALSGEMVWGVALDDDGPSSAVPYEDSIIFGCESCTVFALAADSGEMRWSHWLGDPLLSMPTVANGRVFTVYPAVPPASTAGDEPVPNAAPLLSEPADGSIAPTHVAICFDARSGKTLWRQWIDSDCMTAPVAAEGDLYLASLTGTVYQFGQKDGAVKSARQLRATSVPVVAADSLYVTRRADEASGQVAECIALHNRSSHELQFVAARRLAPYLDEAVQRAASYSNDAAAFESTNGIGGGFGGGFGGGGSGGGGFGSGGSFAVPDQPPADVPAADEDQQQVMEPGSSQAPEAGSSDPLVRTELQAAGAIGLGNVSTLQSFQGSRVLFWKDRLYNCMGDQIVCTSAASGERIWTKQVAGKLDEVGGHLATPPIAAGEFLLVATVNGDVLQMKPDSGEIAASFQVDAPVRFPPVVDQGRIYVTTQDGKVVCIDTGNPSLTGWPLWGRDAAHRNALLQE